MVAAAGALLIVYRQIHKRLAVKAGNSMVCLTAGSGITSQAHVQGSLQHLAQSSQFRLNNRKARQPYVTCRALEGALAALVLPPSPVDNLLTMSSNSVRGQSSDASRPDSTQCSRLK